MEVPKIDCAAKADNTANLVIIPLTKTLLYAVIGDYPQNEISRPMKIFTEVENQQRTAFVDAVAQTVFHIVVDPLDNDLSFLRYLKLKCVNARRLTIDANLMDHSHKVYFRDMLRAYKTPNAEKRFQAFLRFVYDFDQIEELYFGPNIESIQEVYKFRKWGFNSRHSETAKFYSQSYSSDLIMCLSKNLKVLYLGDTEIDPYDLRDAGSTCNTTIRALPMSLPSQLESMEGGPAHACLNKFKNLKTISMAYFGNGFHSETVEELILKTLCGDFNVHQMFPNVKKLIVKMFSPFIFSMAGTLNAGLYDGVVLEEIEILEQIPCFCNGSGHISDSHNALLLMSLLDSYRQAKKKKNPRICDGHIHKFKTVYAVEEPPRAQGACQPADCLCTDVESIYIIQSLKVISLRCFNRVVARFIHKLQACGNQAKIVLYEKSYFKESPEHQSLWNHLDILAKVLDFVPHDKIEIVMKKARGNSLRKIKNKLSHYIPKDVKLSFVE